MGSLLFFGACNGTFYALERATGRVIWKYDVTRDGKQRSFHVNPAADQRTLYVGCDHGQYFKKEKGIGHLYAFDIKTGAVRWKYKVPLGIGSDPVFDERNVFFVTIDDELLSLNKNTGRRDWSFRRPGQVSHLFPKAAPLIDGPRLLFASGDGHLYALEKRTHKIVWQTPLDAGVYTSPVAAGDFCYLISRNKTLYRIDKNTGQIKTSFALPTGPSSSPLLEGASIFIQSARAVHAIDVGKWALKWTADLGSYMAGRFPVRWGDCLVVASQDGRIRCLRPQDGSATWEYSVSAEITGGLAERDGVLYLGTRTGWVHALRLDQP